MSYFDDDVDYGALIAAADEAEKKKAFEKRTTTFQQQDANISSLFHNNKRNNHKKNMNNRESDAGRSTESSVVWPKPGQLGTSSAGNKLEWACSKCTFLNPLSKSHCGACGAVNPSHKNKWAIGYKSYGKISNKITKQNNSMKRSGANKKVIRRDPRANSGAVGNATIQNNGHQQHIFASKKSLGNQQSAINANVNQEHNNYRNQRTSKTTNYSDQANPFQAASRSSDLQGAPFLPIDPQTKDTWFYPTNYPVRQYQRSIVETALFQNTLVCLPTGLGKTFIGAVVMYNYFRWFPGGKIIFMAPTKPLVEQQVEACHQIMSVPLNVTARLDGSIKAKQRKILWKDRQLFFCTPQTLRNDIAKGYVDLRKIVCIVFDEAHRAMGNYAYTVVTQQVIQQNRHFRVLALSATPGSTKEGVQNVIDNLLISHIEVRGDHDPDVKKYTHTKLIEFVDVKQKTSGDVSKLRSQWIEIIRPLVRRLAAKHLLFNSNPEQITKSNAFLSMKKFKENFFAGRLPPGITAQEGHSLLGQLSFLISLGHTNDLLKNHGLASFLDSLEKLDQKVKNTTGSSYKREIVNGLRFQRLLKETRDIQLKGGERHPKLHALIDLLGDHFNRAKSCGRETKAIVFTEYRSSVENIISELEHLKPLIKVQGFVGQSGTSVSKSSTKKSRSKRKTKNDVPHEEDISVNNEKLNTFGKRQKGKGMTQKEQQRVMKAFRNGELNVLVCTSIGEEGLDIGSVDLIISFDAVGSPTRMVQRFGRTGRKRSGRIVVLMTEDDKRKQKMATAKSQKIKNLLIRGSSCFMFYNHNPLMLPKDAQPECIEKSMEISIFSPSKVGGATKKGKNSKKKNAADAWITSNSQKQKFESAWGFGLTNSQHGKVHELVNHKRLLRGGRSYSCRVGQKIHNINHSEKTRLFLNLMNFEGLYGDEYSGFEIDLDQQAQISGSKEVSVVSKNDNTQTFGDSWMNDEPYEFEPACKSNRGEKSGSNSRQESGNQTDGANAKNKLVRKENNSFEQATSAIENTCQDTSQHQQPSSGLDKHMLMDRLIKQYVSDKDPDDIDYDSVIIYVYENARIENQQLSFELFKMRNAKRIESRVDYYVESVMCNGVNDTMVVDDGNDLDSTFIVEDEEDTMDTKLGKVPGIDTIIDLVNDSDDNAKPIVEVPHVNSVEPTTTQDLNESRIRLYIIEFFNEHGKDQKYKVIRKHLENKMGMKFLKRHDEVIKSIAFDVTMQLIENRILQSKDSNIKLVEASNVAQHNTVLATPVNTGKKRMGKTNQMPPESYHIGDRVRVRDGSEWWSAIIKGRRTASDGNTVYNLASDEHDQETSWEMYDVYAKYIKKRHSNYPFSQVSSINSSISSQTPQSSREVHNTAENTFIQDVTPDDSDRSKNGEPAVHSNLKSYFESKYEKRDKSSVIKLFESAIKATEGTELVPPPPACEDEKSFTININETQDALSPLPAQKGGTKKRKKAIFIIDDDDDDDDDEDDNEGNKSSKKCQENVQKYQKPTKKYRIDGKIAKFCNNILPESLEDNNVDDTPCSICNSRDTWDNNQILYCDGCNLAFHQACYGVKKIPTGDYFCDMCVACATKKDEYKSTPKFTFKRNECCLCPNGWLPLQRSKCNRWVHPQCVMFIGEAFFEQGKKADLNSIDPERMKLRCELCAEHANASNDKFPCIQCDAHDCTRAFHVTCAQQKGFSRMILDTSTGQVVCKTFCPAHLHRFTQNQHSSRSNEKKKCKKLRRSCNRKPRNAQHHSRRSRGKHYNTGKISIGNDLIEEEAEISGDEAAHKNDMVDSADANNAYYDVNDSFIHDTQSSHGDTPQGYLAFRQAFSQDSIVGIDIGPNDNNADEITSRRKRARTAMPIIEQCLREIG